MSKPYDTRTDTYKVISCSGYDLNDTFGEIDRELTRIINDGDNWTKKVEVTFIGGVNVIETPSGYRVSQAVLVTTIEL